MKWKYKVGDKIRMKKRGYSTEDVEVGWVSEMDNYISVFMIVECKSWNRNKEPIYRIKRYSQDYCFDFVVHEWQIVPYKNKMKI